MKLYIPFLYKQIAIKKGGHFEKILSIMKPQKDYLTYMRSVNDLSIFLGGFKQDWRQNELAFQCLNMVYLKI